MDQLSPPFRIAIVAMLAVGALWFTVLRPKAATETAPLPTAPGVTGLANDVSAAKGAVAKSAAANAKVQAATGGTAATTTTHAGSTGAHAAAGGTTAATTARPKAAAEPADPAKALLGALDRKHAVVLLFWDRRAVDDRAVRRIVAKLDRHHGRVVVKAVPAAQVGHYDAITRGAQVLQSPTVLVMGPDHKARSIVGLTTPAELGQAVGDTLAGARK